jgi:methylthioribose-1-phosphate isomerase
LRWQDRQLSVLDQRLLPEQVHYDICTTASEVANAIKTMRVRGAPAIGIAAAYAVALSVQQHFVPDNKQWQQQVFADMEILEHRSGRVSNQCCRDIICCQLPYG